VDEANNSFDSNHCFITSFNKEKYSPYPKEGGTYNITSEQLTIGELTNRGYYLGSNVSYNVKKLVEMGYLHHARSRVDRRSVRISLTDTGQQVHDIVSVLYDKHVKTVENIGGIPADDFQRLNASLLRLERFWTDQIRYRL
jgi:DNA-binding MarR family transcriptional regulator